MKCGHYLPVENLSPAVRPIYSDVDGHSSKNDWDILRRQRSGYKESSKMVAENTKDEKKSTPKEQTREISTK